jgi:hypothetical protein
MKHLIVCAAALGILTSAAHAATVNATDDIYAIGDTTDPAGGTVPSAALSVNAGDTLTFNVTTSSPVTLNGGGNFNDADGVGAAVLTSSNTGTASLSGIIAPNAGYLVGVFVPSTGPAGTAPPSLDFTTGTGTSFTSLSPQLDQVFFIGDGLTGDGTGTIQDFVAPTGAGTLYLGISDACNFNGAPGCFNDNSGSFSVAITDTAGVTSAVPEPSTWAMMILGFCGVGFMAYRRKNNQSQLVLNAA